MPKLNDAEKRLAKTTVKNVGIFAAAYLAMIKLADRHYSK